MYLVDEVQQGLRRVEAHQADSLLACIVEDFGVLVEVEAPRLVPLGLRLEDPKVSVVEHVPVEGVLQVIGRVGGRILGRGRE